MPRSILRSSLAKATLTVSVTALAIVFVAVPLCAQGNFKRSGSRRPYTHLIALYDADGIEIDPTAPNAKPYSPHETCKKCHDVATIATGTHFVGSTSTPAGRKGEPFIWVDRRTGTQIPLSYRGWAGTYLPRAVGLDPKQFTSKFGRHLPGTGFGLPVDQPDGQVEISGPLPDIDCLFCHTAGRDYRHSKWVEAIDAGGFAWAPAVAMGLTMGLAKSDGEGTVYDVRRFDSDGKVFFDVVKRTPDDSCYACHTVRPNGTERWLHDDDVHLRAGMQCVDCHRNALDHQTVRGFEGEAHPGGVRVATLTCRGCHMDATDDAGHIVQRGGRLGAPKPLHRGLPPLHLQEMSCTSCHSGAKPTATPGTVQTSLAHELGFASQDRTDADPPLIVEPVLLRDANGRLAPHRMMWPAFWGWLEGDTVTPMPPKDAARAVRRAFRVRQDFRREVRPDGMAPAEIERQFKERLTKALAALTENAPGQAVPVFVSGGRMIQAESITTHPAAEPYAWPIAHDVRPARDSLGASGCDDCHSADAPLLHAIVTVTGPAPIAEPLAHDAHALAGLDPELLSVWERSFEARDTFKLLAAAAIGVVAVVLLIALLTLVRRRRPEKSE